MADNEILTTSDNVYWLVPLPVLKPVSTMTASLIQNCNKCIKNAAVNVKHNVRAIQDGGTNWIT